MPELLLAGGAVTPLCDGARVDGDLRAGRQMFEQAYRTGERKGDAEAMAVAVLGLAGPWVHEQRGAAATTQMQARLRHVLALVPAGSALALRLRARLAGETDYCAGEYAAILAVVEEARRSADPVARVEALSIAHQCLLGPDHGPLRRALATERRRTIPR
ncbi:MAG: hypothetical protein AUI14_24145 [Actinobacteria bacterium 13_2_20CM_2_71_6]|nr:MAG: hypothetical protein AUI14_24145 [Actinobacteria bacterium 13_2_20CM_2_71_6]